jgi:hypothetical protein
MAFNLRESDRGVDFSVVTDWGKSLLVWAKTGEISVNSVKAIAQLIIKAIPFL